MSDTVKPMALRERVERGAAWLDANRPGWLNQIDPGTLDLEDCSLCALGQTFGSFMEGSHVIEDQFHISHWGTEPNRRLASMGFARAGGDDESDAFWERLRNEWVIAILSRRFIAKHQQHGSSVPILDTAMSEVRA